jgi:hypothetical protein
MPRPRRERTEAGRRHRRLDVGDGVDPAVEDRGGEDRVGAAVADRGHEVVRAGGAARGDDRHPTRDVIARSSSVSKPEPVPSRSIEVTRSSPAPRSTTRSAQRRIEPVARGRP